ncbi:hypothetical protein AB1Y20_022915 [Prymnesium parvum]|uniref:Adenylate kinase n=1 Tax=Prymnesium parvum TaxID=97485 RepID=A0AB34JBK0_PRYPA
MSSPSALLEGAAAYVERHKVFQLFEGLMQDLIIKRPDNPIEHLINALKRPEVPRVIVCAPPGAQGRALCEEIAVKLNLVHIIAADVYRELAKAGSALGKEAKTLVDSNEEIPSKMMVELLQEKLASAECETRGWVLEGFPSTATEARAMLAVGILPTRVMSLVLSDEEALRRLSGRRVDPEGNQVYHLTDAPPPVAILGRLVQRPDDTEERVQERLLDYHAMMNSISPLFKKVLKEVDAACSEAELIDACLPLVTASLPSKAPRGCPRVLLLGSPGCGAEALGAALSQRFGAKLISAVDLLQAAALSGSVVGGKVKPFVENGIPEDSPDEIVTSLVLSRLDAEDVRKVGFVMVGCPNNSIQLNTLKKKGVWFRHVVYLQISPEDAKRAVCDTRYDPVDGAMYHPDGNWPDDLEVAARLVPHPHHQPPMFDRALKKWQKSEPVLMKGISNADCELIVEDATTPSSELIERLTSCFLTL